MATRNNQQGVRLEEATKRFDGALGRIYYGWIIVAVATLAVFLSGPGQTYSVSTFIDPLIAEFEWSRAQISGMYSGGTLLAGTLMIVVGRLVDVRGYRFMLTFVAVGFAGALFYMSTVNGLLAIFIGFMLIRTLGQGSLTLIPNSLVPQWFIRRRGRAFSFLAIGAACSSAVLPFINVRLIALAGWRLTWVFWGGVLLLVLAPIAWYFTRERPEDLGLLPDGRKCRPRKDGSGHHDDPLEISWDLPEVMRTGAFWIILLVTAIPSMVGTGAQFHHLSILAENGVAREIAALVFTVAAVSNLIITPLAGYLCDHYRITFIISLYLVLQGVNLLMMLVVTGLGTAVILGVIQGSRMAFMSLSNAIVWPQFFGSRYLASIRGVTTMAMVIGSALGPLPFGLGYDFFGGYQEILIGMTLLTVVGAIVVLFVRRPKRIERTTFRRQQPV